ncbi:MAG: hypothetical protein KAQ83_01470 [Nanoarchaeota archaeon]|nr:hypothetical protein [Nanoarchaeota archaeon]
MINIRLGIFDLGGFLSGDKMLAFSVTTGYYSRKMLEGKQNVDIVNPLSDILSYIK